MSTHAQKLGRAAVAVIFGGLGIASAWAGSADRAFGVNIVLQSGQATSNANGVCISESLSAATNAIVRVACSSGQFVDISPKPGQPFAGTHGGAFRFSFGPGNWTGASLAGTADVLLGMGTVTAMRIYRADEEDGPLEMLVSF